MLLVSCVSLLCSCCVCVCMSVCMRGFWCLCVHLCHYMLVCVCVCACVVLLLVSGAEPLLTVISLFMQCEKGLAGAWTPHALILLRHSPLADPHASPPATLLTPHFAPITSPIWLNSCPTLSSLPVSYCPSFMSSFVNIRNISCAFCKRSPKMHLTIWDTMSVGQVTRNQSHVTVYKLLSYFSNKSSKCYAKWVVILL